MADTKLTKDEQFDSLYIKFISHVRSHQTLFSRLVDVLDNMVTRETYLQTQITELTEIIKDIPEKSKEIDDKIKTTTRRY